MILIALFYELPWYLACVVFMLFTVGVSVVGLIIVRSTVPRNILRLNNEVAGFTFGIVGLLYALQIGFTMVNVQEHFNTLQETVESEASVLADIYRDAAVFPKEKKDAIRKRLNEYIDEVISEEWDKMRVGNSSDVGSQIGHQLWHEYYSFTPTTELEKIWYQQSVSNLHNLNELRLKRMYYSQQSLDLMMWTLLFGGAAMTIVFMYFFHVDNLISHILMTIILSSIISFILLLIIDFDNGFLGQEAITPDAFLRVKHLYSLWN